MHLNKKINKQLDKSLIARQIEIQKQIWDGKADSEIYVDGIDEKLEDQINRSTRMSDLLQPSDAVAG